MIWSVKVPLFGGVTDSTGIVAHELQLLRDQDNHPQINITAKNNTQTYAMAA